MTLPQPPAPPATDRCYRHPDREAGRRCTRCGRPACTQCLVQAAVGSHCVDCAKAARPNLATRARFLNARQPTLVTYVLMAVNVAVFAIITLSEPASLADAGISGRSPDEFGQYDLGLAEAFLRNGEWYRMVTSGFLHFGIIHLAFNMLLLFQLGQLLEPLVGRVRFLLLYVTALITGSAGAMLLQPDAFHGGASGAVFGLMGAAAVAMQRRGVNPFSTSLGTVLMLNLILTFTIGGISIGGHLGGIVGGALAGWFMLAPTGRKPSLGASYAVPAVLIAVALAATWFVVSG